MMLMYFGLFFIILNIYHLTLFGQASAQNVLSRAKRNTDAISSLPVNRLARSIVLNNVNSVNNKLRKKRFLGGAFSDLFGSSASDSESIEDSEPVVASFDTESETVTNPLSESDSIEDVLTATSHVTDDGGAADTKIESEQSSESIGEVSSDTLPLSDEEEIVDTKKKSHVSDHVSDAVLSDIHHLYDTEKKKPTPKKKFDKQDAMLHDIHYLYDAENTKAIPKKKFDKQDAVLSDIHHLYDTETKKPTPKKKFDKQDAMLHDIHHLFQENESENSVELDINHLFQTNDTIPSKHSIHMPALMFPKKNVYESLFYSYTNDMKRIRAQEDLWLPLSYESIATEHLMRANAFLFCCNPMNQSDGTLLKMFVDNYGVLEEQEKMVENCAKSCAEIYGEKCAIGVTRLKAARDENIKLADQLADKSILTLIDTAIRQQIYVDNIVYNYHRQTQWKCGPALILLWRPNLMSDCENTHRLRMTSTSTPQFDDYKMFDEQISKPFQLIMSNIYTDLRIVSNKLKKLINPSDKPLRAEEIEKHVLSIKNQLEDYKPLFFTPTIVHYEKRAHAYAVCCGKMETDDLFDQYLINLNHDFIKIDQLLRSCLHKQSVPNALTDTGYGGDCQVAYNELTAAMGKRQDFLNKNKDKAKDIVQGYTKAITPKLSQASTIKAMKDNVHQYCPDRHVFELMFDPEKVIHCEELIRKALRNNGSATYLEYHLHVSRPFCDLILDDWIELEKVSVNTSPSSDAVIPQEHAQADSIVPKEKPPKKHLPASQEIVPQTANTGVPSILTSIDLCCTTFFLLIIQIIFF